MTNKKIYKLNSGELFAIETLWFSKTDILKSSIEPIVKLTYYDSGEICSYMTFNTREELNFVLEKFLKSKSGILYLASHGKENHISFGNGSNDSITLQELQVILNNKLKGKAIHFSSCSTLNISKEIISEFMLQTNVSVVSGYKKSVYWTDSSALDLLYLTQLQRGKNDLNKFKKSFYRRYKELIDLNGFVMYIQGD